jgi:uncharacterized protein YbjT (DUF2867 family)
MRTFLILGGTGKVGRRVAELVRANGGDARVASRSSGDVRFDWNDPATYGPALADVEGVFVVGPGSASDWTPLLGRFLSAASDAGVRRIVLLSARGVEFLPDGVVAKVEVTVQQGPVPWTILRPSHFAQNFTEAMFVPVDGTVIAAVGTSAEPFIDALDIAEVAAAVLLAGADGEVIELSGPQAITFEEAASILTDHGVPAVFVDETHDEHVARLRAANTPELYITWRMAMLDGIRSASDERISDGVQRVLGRPATSFGDWAAREIGPAGRA